MNGSRPKPNNMNELCRLCLAEDEITSPIFGEEDSSSEAQIPLSFRIMACVSVEVSIGDGLPKVICEKCLFHINSWHEFKQICDLSQATLKEWHNNGKVNPTIGEKDIIIKQEPIDPEPEEEVLEIIEDADSNQFMVEDIKQEVDMYEEDQQDSLSVEAVDEDCESLGVYEPNVSNSETKETENEDVEVVTQADDVSRIRITDIKTECNDIIPLGEVTTEPSEGRLLRSVLQGKKLSIYSKKISNSLNEKLSFQSVKPFNCRLCDKSFSYNYLLKRHEKTHTGDRNVCAYCQKGFSSHASLVQHVRFFSGGNSMSYFCDHCNQEFACRTMYLSHVDGSDGSSCDVVLANKDNAEDMGELQEANCQCEVCSEIFPSLMLLRLHMRKEHLHYSCHKCDKSYKNGVALSNHLRGHSIGSVRHQCESCPRTFPSFDLLKKHERTHMKESTAMTIIPSDVLSKSADFPDMSLPLDIDAFLDRPIKEEPPDGPDIAQEEEQQELMENLNLLQSHVCHLCNEHFPTIASLRFHLKGVHLHYQCHRCPKVYASGVALSNHLRSHSLSNYKKHKCLACLKSFSTIDLLNKHKKIHSAPAALKAVRKKNKKFRHSGIVANDVSAPTFGESAENEISIDEPLVKRTCQICGLVSASPSALERHMACHTKEKMYTCSVCHVSMSYASSLQKHYRLIHNQNVELRAIQKNAVVDGDLEIGIVPEVQKSQELVPGNPETSTRSGRKVIFNRTFRMTAQLQQARLPTPYECKVCHRSFAYRSFLLKHSKVHVNAQSGATCLICFKKFPDAKALNNHKGVHTRFKHYTCHVCGKSFNGLNAWQKHERMHQKGFIYSCKLCGKRFISKAELHEHKKMHIKLKIYTCAVCKNSYHSSSALGKHKRRHSHWYASQKNSDMSEIEVVNGYNVNATKAPVTKPVLSKSRAIKQPTLKTSFVRPGVSKASVSKTLTHFPSGKRRPYCFTCNKTFSHMSALRKHKLLHESLDIKPGFPEKFNAESSVVTEENTCITCNRTFPDHVSLVRHKGWHTRRSHPSAETASVPASGKMPVNPCFVKVEPPVINAYQCSLCSKTFTTSTALEIHVKSHTEVIIKGATIERSKVSADLDVSEVLTSQRRLACKICKKPFESKKALITHIGWHSRDSHLNNPSFNSHKTKSTPKLSPIDKYSCNVCHKLFSSATILGKHKKLHTRKLMSNIKEKSGEVSETLNSDALFTCNVCSKSFKLKKYLHLHMRLHTGEKRFKCTMCPQAYHRSGSLWKHKRTHHGVKVFSCLVCQKRFGLKNQLKRHMEIHKTSVDLTVGDTVFACNRCNKTFPNLTKFKQHQKSSQCHLG